MTHTTCSDFGPDFVIHCAAERRPDVVSGNPQATAALNVSATELIAKKCALVCLQGNKFTSAREHNTRRPAL